MLLNFLKEGWFYKPGGIKSSESPASPNVLRPITRYDLGFFAKGKFDWIGLGEIILGEGIVFVVVFNIF